jgi:hypothetical protein
VIALLYGISPSWFAYNLLNIPEIAVDFSHILRAVMCLYIALGLFWLFSAFSYEYRNMAVLTTTIFSGGLVTGRIISIFTDGWPSPILIIYIVLEIVLVPISYWIYKLPE